MACDQAKNSEVVWEYIDLPTSKNIEQIAFDNNGIGHFVGGDTWSLGIAGISNDGGKTWKVDSICNKRLYDLHFDNSGKGYAVGIDGYLLTYEANERWDFHRVGTFDPHRGVYFGSNQEGITVSGNAFGNGVIQRFNQNYQRIQIDTFDNGLVDVVYSDEKTVHVAGYGLVMRSADGGLTWTRNETAAGDNFQEIQFINESLGYMIGYGGSILKTTDAGLNWEFIRNGKNWAVTDEPFRALYFMNAEEGYVAGENGTLFFTDNGGDDWKHIKNLPKDNFQDITINDNYGWLVGEGGILVRFELL